MRHEIKGQHLEVSDEIKKYVEKKINVLSRHIPKRARSAAHFVVNLEETKSTKLDRFSCEIILRLPKEEIIAKESTVNIFAAVDIVEEKIKNRLHKYKAKYEVRSDRKGILQKFRKLADNDWWGRNN
jgi:putative sigma-54 modulation protein